MGPPDDIFILGVKDYRIAFALCHILNLVYNLADYFGCIRNQNFLFFQLLVLFLYKLVQKILQPEAIIVMLLMR